MESEFPWVLPTESGELRYTARFWLAQYEGPPSFFNVQSGASSRIKSHRDEEKFSHTLDSKSEKF